MTPDGNPLLGPIPGVRGFWVAAGLSLNGFGGAGGLGKALAEWMTGGETEVDAVPYRAWRFGRVYRDTVVASETAREVYRYYYRLRYPLDTSRAGRGRRLSPLHVRSEELGAVFGAKNGWERPDHFEPGRPWRRAGEDQRAFGWNAPPYLDRLAEEHHAVRDGVGIFDLTSFGKLEVSGPGALALLERVCDARIDRPVGRVVYTQFLNGNGGIVADLTVTRLGEDRFRLVTGAAAVDSDRGWLELHADGGVEIRDVSDELAVIGLWGPRARDVLAAVTGDDVSGEALPVQPRARDRHRRRARARRADHVRRRARLRAVRRARVGGAGLGPADGGGSPSTASAPGGYRVLESLRIEKGYRYFGTDLTAVGHA